jgi:ABC-type antimicrobial peptide transport system permease subunit
MHRGRELAVRSALGASPRQIVSGVLRTSLALGATGAAAGLAAASLLMRFLQTMLFGSDAARRHEFRRFRCRLARGRRRGLLGACPPRDTHQPCGLVANRLGDVRNGPWIGYHAPSPHP